jgi:hypothetical protein
MRLLCLVHVSEPDSSRNLESTRLGIDRFVPVTPERTPRTRLVTLRRLVVRQGIRRVRVREVRSVARVLRYMRPILSSRGDHCPHWLERWYSPSDDLAPCCRHGGIVLVLVVVGHIVGETFLEEAAASLLVVVIPSFECMQVLGLEDRVDCKQGSASESRS